jgi:DNA-directed RNA polymerase subunit alpha
MEAIPLPNSLKIEELGNNKYSLTLEPLYPGYGDTIGNALRRVLLSSMPGAAVTAIKIKYVDHEFSTIPNVKEDVIQVILNIKQLRVRSHSVEPVKLQLKVKGDKVVTAADIKETDQVQVLNKDLYIATVDSKTGEFDVELTVEQGRGYQKVEERENQKMDIGTIAIDAIFTPIRSAFYEVTNVRVGHLTNFNKLNVVVETDGTINGHEVIDIASHILLDHYTILLSLLNSEYGAIDPLISASQQPVMLAEDSAPAITAPADGVNEIEDTALSTRAKNALTKNGVITLAALNALSTDEISNMDGLGEKTINEILDFLNRR